VERDEEKTWKIGLEKQACKGILTGKNRDLTENKRSPLSERQFGEPPT
jgi:hypothetical protein